MPKTIYITTIILISAWLLASCGGDSADDVQRPVEKEKQEISIKTNVKKMTEGTTRTGFYTNENLAVTNNKFYCAAYTEGTSTSPYLSTGVTYNGSHWSFDDGSHQWPSSGNLDFFAYMPVVVSGEDPYTYAPPSYISSFTYSATTEPLSHTISFACSDLPMAYTSGSTTGQGSDLKEFVYALALGQNGTDNADGVNLSFQHPFTRIKMELSASQVDPITIKSITFKTIKTGGTFTYNGSTSTWDTSEGASANFVATLNQTVTITNAVQTLGEPYLMIPQSWTGQIEVRIIWDDWGVQKEETLTASAPTTWKIGYSYTYSFTISKSALIVNVARFTEQW